MNAGKRITPKGWLIGGVIVLLIGLGVSAPFWWPGDSGEPIPTPREVVDPRLTFESEVLNIRPNVKYVGDAACAVCHQTIHDQFATHPMGQSALPMTELAPHEQLGPKFNDSFTRFDITYQVERREGQLFHRERVHAGDELIADLSAPVAYALGSGRHGRSYVVEHDGFLFQSPISWYTQQGIWDVSPGFQRDRHFNRPILPVCLLCHVNRAEPMPGFENRYEEPVIRGFTIGCERCHGPGELHVQLHEDPQRSPEGFDFTIANPTHMAQHLRLAVCEQCHLQGEYRVLRTGREVNDFRPGMPLELFWSTFVQTPDQLDPREAVSHPEQFRLSRCFQASGSRMDCTSCHNPHWVPAPEERVSYFRGRCLNCHADQGCALDEHDRLARQADDDCTACHMPKGDLSNVAHTAHTDHRIPRFADAPVRPGSKTITAEKLEHFHADQGFLSDEEIQRDLGIALTQLGIQATDERVGLFHEALPLLEGSLALWPEDTAAWQAKGACLYIQGQYAEALAAQEKVLALQPGQEATLAEAAATALALGDANRAVDYARQAVALNPWSPNRHLILAESLRASEDWQGAADAARACLRLDPTDRDGRQALIASLLRLGQVAEAEAELERLLALEPADRFALRRWFAEVSR